MKEIKDLEILENICMSNYTSYKTGGIAKYLVYPNTIESLIELIKYIKNNNIKYFVLGNGTNIIFTDDFYDGVVINLKKLNNLLVNKNTICVSSGYSLQKLVSITIEKNLSGLEFAAGIPGTVGGAIYMNAGAYGSAMSDIIDEVTYLENDEIKTKKREELEFGYRESYFKKNKNIIIISTKIKLKPSNKKEIQDKIKEYTEKRIKTQPLEYPNAGSVFKNPDNISAGALIEHKLNLKGHNVNDAYISTKHANFIINKGNAKSKDIIKLIKEVQREALEKEGINLELEQEIIK